MKCLVFFNFKQRNSLAKSNFPQKLKWFFLDFFFYKIFINCQYGLSSWQVSTPGGQNYSFPHISNTSANCFQANLNNGGIVRTWGHTIIYVVYASLCQCWIKMTKKEVIWISYHNYQFVPLNLDLYLALHKHIHLCMIHVERLYDILVKHLLPFL